MALKPNQVSRDKNMVTSLGLLIADARKRGIKPSKDAKGREFFQLEVHDGRLRIGAAGPALMEDATERSMQTLVKNAMKMGTVPMKGKDGKDFVTVVFGDCYAYVEPSTDAELAAIRKMRGSGR